MNMSFWSCKIPSKTVFFGFNPAILNGRKRESFGTTRVPVPDPTHRPTALLGGRTPQPHLQASRASSKSQIQRMVFLSVPRNAPRGARAVPAAVWCSGRAGGCSRAQGRPRTLKNMVFHGLVRAPGSGDALGGPTSFPKASKPSQSRGHQAQLGPGPSCRGVLSGDP